jgi:hypothetical protein
MSQPWIRGNVSACWWAQLCRMSCQAILVYRNALTSIKLLNYSLLTSSNLVYVEGTSGTEPTTNNLQLQSNCISLEKRQKAAIGCFHIICKFHKKAWRILPCQMFKSRTQGGKKKPMLKTCVYNICQISRLPTYVKGKWCFIQVGSLKDQSSSWKICCC